ncbi:putative adenosine/adenine deaminase [Longimycelium tulufanense]|uniref:Putative adenosine/adenine deaminase n=2 Tax=Longimycelium tulufanense TaxID=907463 RepID=A0A8J3FZC8_9PSEU|nr:putative adenosine/adenine deaminase [Longimycelium tulufanense]
MRRETLRDLAARNEVAVPLWDQARPQTWATFQGYYDAARAAIRTVDDLRRVVVEAAEDDAADGAGWMEIQVDPTSYVQVFGGLRPVIETVLAATSEACVPTGVIVCSSWARPGAHAEQLARLAVEYAEDGVVGFGLSNDERLGHVDDFTEAFRIAADAGLIRVPHSGFYTGPEHVRCCVERLGATRVGHGISAVQNRSVLALLAERQVALELCPASYPALGVLEATDIPVSTLLQAGVPVVLGSDDPLVFGTSLAGQYVLCREAGGVSDNALAAIARCSIQFSAAPSLVKETLLAGVDRWVRGCGDGSVVS